MNLLTQIPPEARKYLYLAYTVALLAWGAISAFNNDPDPQWVVQGGNVLQYLGIALGITAAANVNTTTKSVGPE